MQAAVSGSTAFVPGAACTIGRAPDNAVVIDDPRASRYHAHIKSADEGSFTIVDGALINGQLRRSANKVFINGEPRYEHQLKNGDRVTIGASTLRFEQTVEERTSEVRYDDKPLGHTQLLISANDVMSTVLHSTYRRSAHRFCLARQGARSAAAESQYP